VRRADRSLNEDTGWVVRSAGHTRRHHLAARHGSSVTVVLGPHSDRAAQPPQWRTRLELANAIFEYPEIFHNRQRRHSALGMLTPIEYELRHSMNEPVA
jgi:transposase InsO family protein